MHQDPIVDSQAAPQPSVTAGVAQLQSGQLDKAELSQQQVAAFSRRDGLPTQLKASMTAMSGISLDDVKVYYDSNLPCQLQAHAFAKGADIHLAPGQERHLPHETWHVVQQKQGRVVATKNLRGKVAINDSPALEREADVMGSKALKANVVQQKPILSPEPQAEIRQKPIQRNSNIIQRSVGFEAEYNVPTYGPPPAAVDATVLANGPEGDAPTPAIQQMLFNGLPYGVNRGQNASFTLKSDHNELQSKASDLLLRLHAMGLVLSVPDGRRSISNLEYVTPALDELAVGARTRFNGLSAAISAHATAIGAGAAARNNLAAIGAPANNTYTGFPLGDMQTWLGSRYGEAQPEIDAFRNAIQDEFYIQATVGIIPSALGMLHNVNTPTDAELAGGIPTHKAAMVMVQKGVAAIERVGWFTNHAYIQGLKNGKPAGFLSRATDPDPITYEALMGVIHVLYSYMVGSALNQTDLFDGSTGKNAVPFMSKMSDFRSIVSLAAPSLHSNRPPDDLVNLIQRAFQVLPATTVDYWIAAPWNLGDMRASGDRSRRPIVNRTTFVSDVLGRRLIPPRVSTGANTGRDRQFDNPDAMPAVIGTASKGQRGAQFEYRYISDRPNAAGIAAVIRKIAEEVMILNSKHVDGQAKIDLLTQART